MQALSIAAAGLTAATARLDASAQRVARWSPASDVDLAREAVEQVSAKTAFKANAAVIRSADRMMGELLDILA
ncbi:MAG TPA: flagellar basal body rod C-terminal domain-containing protein [Caulobacter sp.]|nr:flagellar basal body rod C-terminal domain-containing protein [Caulobacter sp.]